jgi:hypothetical protein
MFLAWSKIASSHGLLAYKDGESLGLFARLSLKSTIEHFQRLAVGNQLAKSAQIVAINGAS